MLPFERQELIKTLSNLPTAQLEQVLFSLNVPGDIIPTSPAPKGERAAALLTWAENNGSGLHILRDVLSQILGEERPELPAVCPYKGLSYFDCNDHDHHYFYGRKMLTKTLLEKIEQDGFLAIVGASGSGKSSVLRAGLLQQLKDRGSHEIRILVPGEHPVQNLTLAFVDKKLERTARAKQLQNLEALIGRGADGLSGLIRTSDAERVVLVIDQFEEAFTLCQNKAERQAFVETLLGALDKAANRLWLILAMRADFVGKCFEDAYGGLAERVKTHLEPVLPMTQDELTQAITTPADQVGLSLEPGLVEALLKDVDPSSGSLPLLQYTLTELWQRQESNQLKVSTYMRLGGVTGTLKQRADAVYDALTPTQQHTAKHIFLSLTQLGEGSEDTRRRVTQDSLISAQHPEPQVIAVVKRLADANLVVTDERSLEGEERMATVDVAHEALIRNWPKLRQWLDENRDLLRQQRRIEQAAEEWNQQPEKQRKRYLLEGRQLVDTQRFKKQHCPELPMSERAETHLARSLTHRRNNRLKLTIAGLIIPFALASYAGVQVTTYFRLRPHWDVVYAYDPENNKIGRLPLTRALQEINDAQRPLREISLPDADLSFADLFSADLSSANLNNANLQDSDFISANLQFANLNNANLRFANLREANLSYADLSYTNLHNAFLISSNLRNASLSFANLSDADLSFAHLGHSSLSNANLQNANLRNANLYDADLKNADLRKVNLHNANLRSIYLQHADLSFANLHNTDLGSASFFNTIFLSTDLRETQNLDQSDFVNDYSPPLICNSPLPASIAEAVSQDRDCNVLPSILWKRYPEEFETQKAAEAYVEEQRQKEWK